MIAIDTSTKAPTALDEAIDLAGALRADRCVSFVAHEAVLVRHDMGSGSCLDIEKGGSEIRAMGAQWLDATVAKVRAARRAAEQRPIETTRARVAEIIAKTATERKADLVAAGAHGTRGLQTGG